MFLPDGEFLPESSALTDEHLKALRDAHIKTLDLQADARIQSWECVPELNTFMSTLSERFGEMESDGHLHMIRCAVEDVYTRFIFDLESER